MSEELKPCPFCGNDKLFSKNSWVECLTCGVWHDKNDWNTRTQPEVSVPTSIKWPDSKKWIKELMEDRAMTINMGSDNFKTGYNMALKDCKKAYEEAHKIEPSKEVISMPPKKKFDVTLKITDIKKGKPSKEVTEVSVPTVGSVHSLINDLRDIRKYKDYEINGKFIFVEDMEKVIKKYVYVVNNEDTQCQKQ